MLNAVTFNDVEKRQKKISYYLPKGLYEYIGLNATAGVSNVVFVRIHFWRMRACGDLFQDV